MTQKKKVVLGLIVGTAVMASVFAVAASITVTSETLGAGGSGVSTCDDAVKATYTTAYSAATTSPVTPSGYKVTDVKVSEVLAACEGKSYKIQFTTGTGGTTQGAEQTGTVPTLSNKSGTPAQGDFTHTLSGSGTPVPASDITGVYVVFSG